MALTSEEKIEKYLKRDLTANEVSFLSDNLLDAVDQYISDYTGRTYASGGTTRYYDGSYGRWLFIDPVTTITAVEYIDEDGDVDETLDSTDYIAYPLNKTVKTSLWKRGSNWTGTHNRIKITGTFTETAPATIVLAATMLAAKYLEAGSGNLKSESIEGYSRTFSDTVHDDLELQGILDAERGILL